MPTPTPILKARGSRRAEQRAGEVVFPAGKPTCPNWLSSEAKAEWKRQVKQLELVGVLASVDRAMLTLYCEAWAEFVEAATKIREIGQFVKVGQDAEGRGGTIKLNPLLRVRDAAAVRVVQIGGQFGFSPAARTRVRAASAAAPDVGPSKLRFFQPEESE